MPSQERISAQHLNPSSKSWAKKSSSLGQAHRPPASNVSPLDISEKIAPKEPEQPLPQNKGLPKHNRKKSMPKQAKHMQVQSYRIPLSNRTPFQKKKRRPPRKRNTRVPLASTTRKQTIKWQSLLDQKHQT